MQNYWNYTKSCQPAPCAQTVCGHKFIIKKWKRKCSMISSKHDHSKNETRESKRQNYAQWKKHTQNISANQNMSPIDIDTRW